MPVGLQTVQKNIWKKIKKVLFYSYEYVIIYLTKEIRLDQMASTLKKGENYERIKY